MAEEEEEQSEEDAAPLDEAGSSRLPQFIVLIFVILLGQGAAGYYLITQVYYPGLIEEPEEESQAARTRGRPVFEIDEPLLYSLGEMTTNPPHNEGIRFLTARVTIEVDSPDALAVFEEALPATQLHDLVFVVLATTKFNDMDEADEREAIKVRLKEEINASPLLEEAGEVTNVYFERFVLQ